MKFKSYACVLPASGLVWGLLAVACGGPAVDDQSASMGGKGATGGSRAGGKSGGAAGGGAAAGNSGGARGGNGGSSASNGGAGGVINSGGGGSTPVSIDAELIGHWKFEGNTMDSSRHGNHGTSVKGNREDAEFREATFAPGKRGQALDLGANPAIDIAGVTAWEWIKVPNSDSINTLGVNGKFSAAAWVNVKTFDETADDFNFVITRHELGTFYDHFGLGLLGGAPAVVVHSFTATAANAISPGAWHHIAGTYDGIEQTVYLDGEVANSASIGWPIAADSTHTIIGADQNIEAVKEGFSGLIDEVRLYSDALTPAQVKTLMDQ